MVNCTCKQVELIFLPCLPNLIQEGDKNKKYEKDENKMGNLSRMSWQDVYWDGKIDEKNQYFCEDTQSIHKSYADDGWDTYRQCGNRYKDDLEYERRMMNGEIKRIR